MTPETEKKLFCLHYSIGAGVTSAFTFLYQRSWKRRQSNVILATGKAGGGLFAPACISNNPEYSFVRLKGLAELCDSYALRGPCNANFWSNTRK
jgi:hypothetical protein